MNGLFKEIKTDKVISKGFIATFIIFFITLAYILLKLGAIPPYVPLFNQLPWGEQRLGTTFMIFLPLAVVALIGITNILICSFVYKKSQIVSRILAISSVLVSFLSFLFIIRTIQLIT